MAERNKKNSDRLIKHDDPGDSICTCGKHKGNSVYSVHYLMGMYKRGVITGVFSPGSNEANRLADYEFKHGKIIPVSDECLDGQTSFTGERTISIRRVGFDAATTRETIERIKEMDQYKGQANYV